MIRSDSAFLHRQSLPSYTPKHSFTSRSGTFLALILALLGALGGLGAHVANAGGHSSCAGRWPCDLGGPFVYADYVRQHHSANREVIAGVCCYGWEKLFSERMARHFMEDFGLETRVARYHNVYGPWGTYDGGREKAPAAICRKVIEAQLSQTPQIEIWGDGEQTRSFMYIDDCISGTLRLAESDVREPLNLGSDELVSINELVSMVEDIAGVKLKRNYKLDAPRGVRGRNSDNAKIKKELGWAPSIKLRDGMAKTYAWIRDELTASGAIEERRKLFAT